jgi:hypothetical protein
VSRTFYMGSEPSDLYTAVTLNRNFGSYFYFHKVNYFCKRYEIVYEENIFKANMIETIVGLCFSFTYFYIH